MLIKLLLVEDNLTLAKMVCRLFKQEKFEIEHVTNGEDALEYISLNDYDTVILDWMLPGISGVEVCQKLRNNGYSGGIVMLTAKGEKDDKIEGLDMGADDYVTKPFDFDELAARVKAVSRRSQKIMIGNVVSFGNVELDSNRFIVKINGHNVELTNKEFKLLELFLTNKENIVSRDIIFSRLWGNENGVMPNTLEVYIKMLRNKLADYNSNVCIKTVRGWGYKLEIEQN